MDATYTDMEKAVVLQALAAAGVSDGGIAALGPTVLQSLHAGGYTDASRLQAAQANSLRECGLSCGDVDLLHHLLRGPGGGGSRGGTVPPVTGPTLLDDTHPMSKFMACLLRNKDHFAHMEAGQTACLDEGVFFPATKMSQLYVRRCFLDLLACDRAFRRMEPLLGLTYVTGTPGTGKNCCGALHLCWCLLDNKTVILEVVEHMGRELFRLKLGEKVAIASRPDEFRSELDREEVCYFVDGGLPGQEYFKTRTWVYTSPRAMSRRDLKTVRVATQDHILKMPGPSLDELLMMGRAVACFKKVSEDTIALLFGLAGGSARLVLEGPALHSTKPSDIQDMLLSEVADLSSEAVRAELGSVGGFSGSADALVHWHVLSAEEVTDLRSDGSPEEKELRRFKKHVLQFASPYVAALVARHTNVEVRRLCASFLLTQPGDRGMGGSVGTQFEQLVHLSLPNMPAGTKLRMKLLGNQEELELTLPPSTPLVFTSAVEAANASRADCTMYLLPANPNFAAIDCLSSRKLLFQIASGPSHSIDLNGLRTTCEALTADKAEFGKAHDALVGMLALRKRRRDAGQAVSRLLDETRPLLVFVTPDVQYPNWNNPQQYKVPGGFINPQFPPVQQAVLCFPTQQAA